MNKKWIWFLLTCVFAAAAILIVLMLPREGRGAIREENAARFGELLGELVNAYESPADGDEAVIQAALADIRKAGGEEACETCAQLVAPEENKATYYTLTSIKAGTPTNPVREAIIKSAEQCLGHPYVWGGTDLLTGCDCSSFVQGLYSIYGITLPRVAENQAEFGRQIPVDNAIPGDLIFFAKDGYVYHVALYVGNDQTIEAYSAGLGIIRNMVDHANAVWATRVIED